MCTGELQAKVFEYKNCVYRNLSYLTSFPDRIFQQAANTSTAVCIKQKERNIFKKIN